MINQRFLTRFILLWIFLCGVDVQAQRIEQLLCMPSWWQSNPSNEDMRSTLISRDVFTQLCNEDNDTPIHIVLRLENHPLLSSQWAFVQTAFLAVSNDNIFLRNRRGETPLTLVELRMERLYEHFKVELEASEKEGDTVEVFDSFSADFTTEGILYLTVKALAGDSLEAVLDEMLSKILVIGLEHIFDQEEFLENLRERLLEELEKRRTMPITNPFYL